MNHILNIVRKYRVKEYVYAIKLLAVMLLEVNVVRNVACLSNGMDCPCCGYKLRTGPRKHKYKVKIARIVE